jgi:hypothetical protein
LNLGRGLYAASELANYLEKYSLNIALILYDIYWDSVVKKEFCDPIRNLIDDDEIFYKYVIRGRFVDGRVLGNYPSDLQFYIDAKNKKITNKFLY